MMTQVQGRARPVAKTWTVKWNGHEIVAVNTWFRGERLYVDGRLCDQTSGALAISSELRGRIENVDGSTSMVVAKLRQGMFGATIHCHILVDDKWIGGDPV